MSSNGKVQQLFKNRIVGYGVKPASEFLANPWNFKIHTQFQQQAIEDILKEIGWVQDVIENITTGHVLDGHARITIAYRMDDAPVPYKQVQLSEDEEKLLLSVFDYLAGMIATDATKLDELLREVNTDSEALQLLLAQEAAKAGLYEEVNPNELWRGMSEFEQEDGWGAVGTVKVHFAANEDIMVFAELMGQTVNEKTKSIWYPKQERENLKQYIAHES